MRDNKKNISWIITNRLSQSIKSEESLIRFWREGKTSWSNGLGEIEALGKLRLVENNIEDARTLFREGIDLLLKNLPINQAANWELAYLGAGLNTAREVAQGVLIMYEKDIEPSLDALNELETRKAWQCLIASHVSGDGNRIEKYMKIIENECSEIQFDETGLPFNIPKHLECGFAIFGERMIKGLIEMDNSLLERNMNLWSNLLHSRIKKSTHPLNLVSTELIYIYDISLGIGMKPKIDTPFIPRAILENGYWNRP